VKPGSIILTAALAGIYSGVLDGAEKSFGLNNFTSASFLVLFTYGTGYFLFKLERKSDRTNY
jgi:hypothetical protein